MKKILLLIFLLSSMSLVHANSFLACPPATVKFEANNIILPGPVQARSAVIYFFRNNTEESLWLDHPVAHPSASAGWSSYIQPGNWSALILNRKNFAISCAVINPGKVDYLECKNAVSVCSPKEINLPKRKTTYWLIENKPWDELVAAVKKRLL